METNEDLENIKTAQNAENAQIKENTQPSAKKADVIKKQDTAVVETQATENIDLQKTQRIEILSELIKDTEIAQRENFEAKLKAESCIKAEKITDDQPKKQEANKTVEDKNEKNDETKEKKHTQDKKDYRLEKLLLDRINAMQGKIKESLELIKKFERINAKEENLPNIVTTLRDKLTLEVIKQFRTVGIEFNMKSYLVQAVVSDLLSTFEEGITEFKECSENLNFVKEVQEDFESRVELAPTSKVKNMFARLRGLFKPERKQERLIDLERARQEKKLEEANIHLIKYKYKNSELDKYTIRKNIVGSLTREMLNGKSSGLNLSVSEFIGEKISPEMEKLGLQYLNEALEENLYKEYNEKCSGASKEDFLKMLMGDVKKSVKAGTLETAVNKITMVNNAKQVEQEEDRVAI